MPTRTYNVQFIRRADTAISQKLDNAMKVAERVAFQENFQYEGRDNIRRFSGDMLEKAAKILRQSVTTRTRSRKTYDQR